MKQGELYERTSEELLDRIGELELENEQLGDEVSQWMRDYDELWKEKEDLNLALIRADQMTAQDTRLLTDILKELESGEYDVESICSWIRDALRGTYHE